MIPSLSTDSSPTSSPRGRLLKDSNHRQRITEDTFTELPKDFFIENVHQFENPIITPVTASEINIDFKGLEKHPSEDLRILSSKKSSGGMHALKDKVKKLLLPKEGEHSGPRSTSPRALEDDILLPIGLKDHLEAQQLASKKIEGRRKLSFSFDSQSSIDQKSDRTSSPSKDRLAKVCFDEGTEISQISNPSNRMVKRISSARLPLPDYHPSKRKSEKKLRTSDISNKIHSEPKESKKIQNMEYPFLLESAQAKLVNKSSPPDCLTVEKAWEELIFKSKKRPDKILVNGCIVFANLQKEIFIDGGPNNFFFCLFKSFYEAGYMDLPAESILEQVHIQEGLMLLYHESSENEENLDFSIYETIPCLKIVDAMITDYTFLADHYFKQLFPGFFPDTCINTFFSVQHGFGMLECHVNIIRVSEFEIEQVREMYVCSNDKFQTKIATVSYMCRYKPCDDTFNAATNFMLKNIDCKVHDENFRNEVMDIYNSPIF